MRRLTCTFAVLTMVGCIGEIPGDGLPGGASGPSAGIANGGGTSGSGADSPGSGPGTSTNPATPPGTPGTPGKDMLKPPAACGGVVVLSPSPMRRLTRVEYNNTVRDLLFVTGRPATGVFDTEDDRYGGFEANSIAPLTRVDAESYLTLAERLGAEVDLTKILMCDPVKDGGEDACARTFVTKYGRRAYRRALTVGEIDRLLVVYKAGRTGADFQAGIRLVITSTLQAGDFMYRPEISTTDKIDAKTVALSGSELASRLSYFIWSSMPDDAVLTLGESGGLANAATLEKEARRMLADPKASETFRSFTRQWLGLREMPDKDAKLFPEFNQALWASMTAEADAFSDYVFRQGEGRLTTWLTAPFSFVDAPLAKLYGATAPKSKTAFEQIILPADQRSGILTGAAMLTMRSFPSEPSPIHRGKFIREALFCQSPPPPPPDVKIVVPARNPNSSTKQRFDAHRKEPACANCHELMDPLGYAFMGYDAIGKWQTMDGKFPVDAAGEIKLTPNSNAPYNGAVDLGKKLAASPDVQRCMSEQWLRFALGRPDGDGESCAIDDLYKKFSASNQDMRELMVAVTGSLPFRARNSTN